MPEERRPVKAYSRAETSRRQRRTKGQVAGNLKETKPPSHPNEKVKQGLTLKTGTVRFWRKIVKKVLRSYINNLSPKDSLKITVNQCKDHVKKTCEDPNFRYRIGREIDGEQVLALCEKSFVKTFIQDMFYKKFPPSPKEDAEEAAAEEEAAPDEAEETQKVEVEIEEEGVGEDDDEEDAEAEEAAVNDDAATDLPPGSDTRLSGY